ncbi:MAG: flagellin, partial [Candidatus Kapabacteria bacterium]|nr:flagellin [Candidatus Kapabacteria bacterium]
MPVAISGGSRIRTNIPAENAYNSLLAANNNIALRQLRLSTGKRINAASDDVAGYITSRALSARNSSLKSALNAVGEAKNVTAISQDALDNIQGLINEIKTSAATASSGALGTDEKVALAKGAYRLAQQIQFITDSTVFGGKQLLQGAYTGDWTVGFYADNTSLKIEVNISTDNSDYNITGGASGDFNLNATSDALASAGGVTSNFAGVQGLTLEDLDSITTDDLGIFSVDNIDTTLQSLSQAIDNVNKVASYIGGIEVRLNSQESLLTSQITNYNAAISRIEDADVATEQL